jgi:hypothetical protein
VHRYDRALIKYDISVPIDTFDDDFRPKYLGSGNSQVLPSPKLKHYSFDRTNLSSTTLAALAVACARRGCVRMKPRSRKHPALLLEDWFF